MFSSLIPSSVILQKSNKIGPTKAINVAKLKIKIKEMEAEIHPMLLKHLSFLFQLFIANTKIIIDKRTPRMASENEA